MLFKNNKKTLPYNLETIEFLNLNSISLTEISQITENIIEPKDIDSILEYKSITTEEETALVSIEDIIGYSYPKKRDIFESISEFFDSQKDGYHSRSLSILQYTPDNIIPGLSNSFIVEPMKVKKVENGKCFIVGNGMHRFTILRIMYLLEKYRGKNLVELRKKYTIPVILNKVDKTKTYCAYIISILNENIYIRSELDSDYHKTNRVEVIDSVNNTKNILTDEDLIIYTSEVIRDSNIDLQALLSLSKQVEINSSFKAFLSHHFNDLLTEIERFIEFKKNVNSHLELSEYQLAKKKEDSKTWTL